MDRYTDSAAKEIVQSGRRVTPLTPLAHAVTMFVKVYFLQRGFLDGFAGLSVAVLSFCYSFVKYAKVLTLRHRESTEEE